MSSVLKGRGTYTIEANIMECSIVYMILLLSFSSETFVFLHYNAQNILLRMWVWIVVSFWGTHLCGFRLNCLLYGVSSDWVGIQELFIDLDKDFVSWETCHTIILDLVYPRRPIKLCVNGTYGEINLYLAYFLAKMVWNKMLYRQSLFSSS
jgi:hypothetical protein